MERRTAALQEALAAAEQASRVRSEFLATMSHEIGTPMNGVLGTADLLDHGDLDPEHQESLRIIRESGAALLRIIDDVLELSRIEAGGLVLETEPFDLRQRLQDLVGVHESTAGSRGLGIHLEVGAQVPPVVLGDPVRVYQVVGNLLGNALKFTTRGEVRVHVGVHEGDLLRFEIHDTGPGLAPGDRERIFEAFERGDTSFARRHGGTGLGLTISARLVRAMDGEIGVDSQEGEGSTFWFTAHLPASDRPVVASLPQATEGGTSTGCGCWWPRISPSTSGLSGACSTGSAARPRWWPTGARPWSAWRRGAGTCASWTARCPRWMGWRPLAACASERPATGSAAPRWWP